MQGGKNNLIKELTEGIFLRQFVSDSMVKNTISLADEFLEEGNKVFIACCFNDEIAKLKHKPGKPLNRVQLSFLEGGDDKKGNK